MATNRPEETEYAPSYEQYVSLVPEEDIMDVLEAQEDELKQLAASIHEEKGTFRYAPGKWSIRELLGHLCDAERVFGYRTFCISRGDPSSLPGFDENRYVSNGDYDMRTIRQVVAEFSTLRRANMTVFERLTDKEWARFGTANDVTVSVRALAYIVAGHFRHHLGVLRDRYHAGVRE